MKKVLLLLLVILLGASVWLWLSGRWRTIPVIEHVISPYLSSSPEAPGAQPMYGSVPADEPPPLSRTVLSKQAASACACPPAHSHLHERVLPSEAVVQSPDAPSAVKPSGQDQPVTASPEPAAECACAKQQMATHRHVHKHPASPDATAPHPMPPPYPGKNATPKKGPEYKPVPPAPKEPS